MLISWSDIAFVLLGAAGIVYGLRRGGRALSQRSHRAAGMQHGDDVVNPA